MKLGKSYFRNMVFGAEDSLVSTVGVLFGVASASYDKTMILVTGLIVIVVEAISMGAGAFLSETSTQEVAGEEEGSTIMDGIIMFASYFFAGFVPLTPYILFTGEFAKYMSIVFSLIGLFFLGFLPQKKPIAGFRMVIVAGLAIFFGYIIATFSEHYLP